MPLKQVIENIQKESGKVLCVFDLDSTLFDVSPRTQFILREFAHTEAHMRNFPAATKAIQDIEVLSRDWGIKQALSRHQVEATIDFFDALRSFWIERFFSSDYLEKDEPYPGSIEYVTELHKLGARIIYLTGRDKKRMGEGTVRVLKKHQFPLDEEHVLMLKPHTNILDSEFKAQVFQDLSQSYDSIWFFENEPVNVNLIQQMFPKVKIIFMDSTHSGREDVDEKVPRISLEFPVSE